MNDELLESDKEHIKKKICEQVDIYFNDLKKINEQFSSLKSVYARVERNRTMLARGYAVNVRILLTKKQYTKKYKQPEE